MSVLLLLLKSPFYLLRLMFVAYRSRYRGREKWEVFRVLAVLWLKTTFSKHSQPGGHYQQSLFGFLVVGNSYQAILRLFKEIFLAEPYVFTPGTATPLIIDAGANIGMAVLYFKKEFPNARIVAFEPNPDAFRLLAHNVAANKISGVELHNVALAATTGELPFYFGTDGASLTASLFAHVAGVRAIRVPTRRLSEFIESTTAVDLLKLDVEGAEPEILADLDQTGRLRYIQQLIVEYHYPIGTADSPQLAACLQTFERRGFAYYFKLVYPRVAHEQDIILHCWQLK